MNTDIWSENSTGEVELMEFIIGGDFFCVNTAQAKEISVYQNVLPAANEHPAIEGMIMLRDTAIDVIDLKK